MLLTLLLITGIITFLAFLSIFVAMFLGSYNDRGLEEKTSDSGQHYTKSGSVSFEVWEVIIKSLKGELRYIPFLLFFVFIHFFSACLFLFLITNVDLDPIVRIVMYVFLIFVPISFVRHIYRSYRRVSRNSFGQNVLPVSDNEQKELEKVLKTSKSKGEDEIVSSRIVDFEKD